MMQRLMDDDTSFANDLFRLNMLRLSEQGGPVDYIGIGYTCDDDQTVLESVLMRENQHDKDALYGSFYSRYSTRGKFQKKIHMLCQISVVFGTMLFD